MALPCRKPNLPQVLGQGDWGRGGVINAAQPLSLGPTEAPLGARVPHSLFPSHQSPSLFRQDRRCHLPSPSLVSLSPYCPFVLQLKRNAPDLFVCEIQTTWVPGDVHPVLQSELSYNSFMKSTNICKAPPKGQSQSASGSVSSPNSDLSARVPHHCLISDCSHFSPRRLR